MNILRMNILYKTDLNFYTQEHKKRAIMAQEYEASNTN